MTGRTISHFRVLEKLGGGGMGEVYLAEDTKLDRRVALKVLPPHALASQDDRARFYREARAAAALNHTNIGHVYEIDEAMLESGETRPFIAMEYVDGESLADRIARGPVPLQDVISIGSQIAGGLAAAHAKDIVHRDVKPSNVMLTKAGEAKILDFGLAKTAASTKLTRMGSTLGTFAYMSPEQARGEEVDARTDVWSLGAVLYEMITGRVPFPGEYEQAVVYGILNEDPEPPTAVRTGVPMELERIVLKCLSKDRRQRYQHIDEVGVDLGGLKLRSGPSAQLQPSRYGPRSTLRGRILYGVAAFFLVIAASAITRTLLLVKSAGSAMSISFLEPVPEGEEIFNTYSLYVAVSPDGRHVVYVTSEGLRVRSLDRIESRLIEGTTEASSPFFSPDSKWIGYSEGGALHKVSIDGGPAVPIVANPGGSGAHWWNDWIYVGGGWRVPATGGDPEKVVDPDDKHFAVLWPQVLPGGDEVLFTVIGKTGDWQDAKVVIERLGGGDTWVVAEQATFGRYMPSGHILLVQSTGTVAALPYNLEAHRQTGSAVPVLSDIRLNSWGGGAQLAVSDAGTIAYVTGGRIGGKQIITVDRSGQRLHQIGEAADYEWRPRLSPDGQRLTTTVRSFNDDVWVLDVPSGRRERISFDPGEDETSVWSPDGSQIAYSGERERRVIIVRSVDGSGEETVVYESDNHIHVWDWTPDGGLLVYTEGVDIRALPVAGGEPEVVVSTPTNKWHASVSPDSRWIAYGSAESGTLEVYVQGFRRSGGPWQVSDGGGGAPAWSADGRELFYLTWDSLMVVPVELGNTFRWGSPHGLFASEDYRFVDVGAGANTFLIDKHNPEAKIRRIHIVTNWLGELSRQTSGGG